MAISNGKYVWETESYVYQKSNWWPKYGKHILAQYDEDTIVVYQAYKPDIAKYAVENQRFGGPHFRFERMSWIKTNFLWMMYRCGWASKKDQECVLAVRITREGFEKILSQAAKNKKVNAAAEVRLQWDPDHSPTYGNMERRAIQLGLKGKVLEQYATEWIVNITDITDFVKEQHMILQDKGQESILTAKERVYTVDNPEILARIEPDEFVREEHFKPKSAHTETKQTDNAEGNCS